MRTAGIVVGIVASLELAWRLGAPLSISPNPVALGPLGAQFVGATLISAFFALWAYADLATIGLAGAIGLLGWAGYASMIYIGSTEVPANTLGAFVAALASTLLIRRTTIPAFGLVSAALLPWSRASPSTTASCRWSEPPRRQPIQVRVGQLCWSLSVSLWA